MKQLSSPSHLLLTGPPGIGKTTLIIKLAEQISALNPVGFFTREIRGRGIRLGFELVSLQGEKRILAHVDIKSPHRVGKYGVDIDGFNRFLGQFHPEASPGSPVIIDEIGRMECLSNRFTQLITALLDSPRPILATVALRGDGFISAVKTRPDILLHQLTLFNRNDLVNSLATALRSATRK